LSEFTDFIILAASLCIDAFAKISDSHYTQFIRHSTALSLSLPALKQFAAY
jgi:hypothetical protein